MTAPRIIGLAGRAGTGKSTIARLLCEQHAFVEIALADPIKRALAAMLDLPSAYSTTPSPKTCPSTGCATPPRGASCRPWAPAGAGR